jgi:ketopantoate reductase
MLSLLNVHKLLLICIMQVGQKSAHSHLMCEELGTRSSAWNGTYNTVCALMYMDCGEVQRSSAREELVIPLMREIWNVARADGYDLPEELIQHMAFRSLETSRCRPSMLLDRENRRPMKFEVILGDHIKRAAELGIQASIMTTVYELLKLAREKVESKSKV